MGTIINDRLEDNKGIYFRAEMLIEMSLATKLVLPGKLLNDNLTLVMDNHHKLGSNI